MSSRTAEPKAPQNGPQRWRWCGGLAGDDSAPMRAAPAVSWGWAKAVQGKPLQLPKLAALRRRLCRPSGRLAGLLLWLAMLFTPNAQGHAQGSDAFHRFLEGVWPEAQAMGVSRATFDKALRGVEPDLALPDLVLPGKTEVKGQAEFTRTPAEYLNASYLAKLADQGKALQTEHAKWLAKIESELGIQRQFVLAIWGSETAFGSYRSSYYLSKALATQAFLGRRKDMFRTELIYALKMLEDGVRTRENFTGSWAGAMGLTQFMPSEFYTMGYDLDGDSRVDIWNSVA